MHGYNPKSLGDRARITQAQRGYVGHGDDNNYDNGDIYCFGTYIFSFNVVYAEN